MTTAFVGFTGEVSKQQTLAEQIETLLVARSPGHSILGDLRDGGSLV
jgi:hypothetical protein